MLGKKFKSSSPFKTNNYYTRSKRIEVINKPDSIYAKKWFGNTCVFAFVFIDLFCLKVVWNLVQTESPLFVWALSLACAAALDVPLAVGAIALKKYCHGLYSRHDKNLVLGLSVLVFAIAFLFSFGFRLFTGELSFETGDGQMLVNSLDIPEEDGDMDMTVLFASIYNGVIPLLTSLCSFIVSYFSYNPLVEKVEKIRKERVGIQSNIIDAERALAEIENSDTYVEKLLMKENGMYKEFITRLDAEALSIKQMVRVLMMEKLSSEKNCHP